MSLPAARDHARRSLDPGEHREGARAPSRVDSSPPRRGEHGPRDGLGHALSRGASNSWPKRSRTCTMCRTAAAHSRFDGVVEAGRRAGAFGVTISGSGRHSCLPRPGRGKRIGRAMVKAFARHGHGAGHPGPHRGEALTLRRFSSLWPLGVVSTFHAVVGSKVRARPSDRRSGSSTSPTHRADAPRRSGPGRGRSAMGTPTDDLIGLARQCPRGPIRGDVHAPDRGGADFHGARLDGRERPRQKLSFTGSQRRQSLPTPRTRAKILEVKADRIRAELDKGAWIVAGSRGEREAGGHDPRRGGRIRPRWPSRRPSRPRNARSTPTWTCIYS